MSGDSFKDSFLVVDFAASLAIIRRHSLQPERFHIIRCSWVWRWL